MTERLKIEIIGCAGGPKAKRAGKRTAMLGLLRALSQRITMAYTKTAPIVGGYEPKRSATWGQTTVLNVTKGGLVQESYYVSGTLTGGPEEGIYAQGNKG